MKKILCLLVLSVASASLVLAQHRLDKMQIFVELLPNGDAKIVECRWMELGDQGTEIYEKEYDLADRDMHISEFGVADSIRGEYEYVTWDVNASRQWKAGRCGINDTEQGPELCWGFGQPGPNLFVTHYLLHNLVQSYTDYDGFNHCFYDAAEPPAQHVEMTVWLSDSTQLLSHDNSGFWHFKYHGEGEFTDDGEVKLNSTEPLDSGHKVVLMMQFDKGIFEPKIQHEETFVERVKERAFIDSDYTLDDPGNGSSASAYGGNDISPFEDTIIAICSILLFVLLPIILIIRAILIKPLERRRRKKLILQVLGNPDQIPYHREPPLEGHLIESQNILRNSLGMLGRDITFGTRELTEALILRLVYKGQIDIVTEQTEKGELRDVFRIQPIEQNSDKTFYSDDEEMERGLQNLLYLAAGDDHLLQPDELKTFTNKESNTLTVRSFTKKFAKAVDNRYITTDTIRNISPTKAREVFGFWQYLNDFSIIGEREIVEVKLWKDYLVFGALYGMARKVREDMKKVCPDYNALDDITRRFLTESSKSSSSFLYVSMLSEATYDTVRYTSVYETEFERRLREDRESLQRRHSGGGGASSFGGGGGFSGGGGSGVR